MPITNTIQRDLGHYADLKDGISTYDYREASYRVPLVEVTSETFLGAEDTGKTLLLNKADGFTIHLPTASQAPAGWNVKFLVKTVPTSAPGYVISSSAGETVIHGVVQASTVLPTSNNTAFDTITLTNDVINIGEYVTVTGDGTFYYVEGSVSGSNAVTFA